jgi:glutamate racemase
VLGCTHFPALKNTLAKVAGPAVTLVDSAETTAQSVEEALAAAGLLHDGPAQPPLFLATDAPDRFSRVGEIFLGAPIDPGQVKLIDL